MINRTNIGGDMIGKTANKINTKGSRTGKGKMANTIDKKVGTTIDPMGSKAGSKSNVTKTVRLRLLSAGQDLGGGFVLGFRLRMAPGLGIKASALGLVL